MRPETSSKYLNQLFNYFLINYQWKSSYRIAKCSEGELVSLRQKVMDGGSVLNFLIMIG